MSQKILLINPPFTQLNTPYPATAYLKGYLNTRDVESLQIDLGIETILSLFTEEKIAKTFKLASENIHSASDNAIRIYNLADDYLKTIDAVIHFLQNQDPTMAYAIAERNFLPEASRFDQLDDVEWAFGHMGIRDKARYLATLYLEDLSDFIIECIDPQFGFSRYAERLALSAHSFDEIYQELSQPDSFISEIMLIILKKHIRDYQPTLVCLSVPFPGNLFAALKCGQWIKQYHPDIKIVMGGGYPNTELRSLKDQRTFEFVDYICLDDGEAPIMELINYLNCQIEVDQLKRTYVLQHNQVTFLNGSLLPDVKQENVGTPDYTNLPLNKYLSVIQLTNPMHRLWSDGRWNKLTMAHGCYWGKCTFCDISLDYIQRYEASSATLIVDRMVELMEQTGETGFHFVDEAAPPALMKAVAIEILRRNLVLSWWTNIRFEKSFTFDLCRLLHASGCIAVSGGLEVASDRLLKLIAKGVTVEQVTKVTSHFREAGIMVHAYLMYGFPTQTDQETVDSLEVVRQLFEADVLQSAFWHRFAMTAHSPVGMYPEDFNVQTVNPAVSTFAHNDLAHHDPTGGDHDAFQEGLKKSLYNFMHGVGFDFPLQKWFNHSIPATSLPPDLINTYLSCPSGKEMKNSHHVLWIGGRISFLQDEQSLLIFNKQDTIRIGCTSETGVWLADYFSILTPQTNRKILFEEFRRSYETSVQGDFTLFWYGDLMENLKAIGLLVL